MRDEDVGVEADGGEEDDAHGDAEGAHAEEEEAREHGHEHLAARRVGERRDLPDGGERRVRLELDDEEQRGEDDGLEADDDGEVGPVRRHEDDGADGDERADDEVQALGQSRHVDGPVVHRARVGRLERRLNGGVLCCAARVGGRARGGGARLENARKSSWKQSDFTISCPP